ncbi:MAG TPA: alpha/beta fold hydrolase [Longimicrobiales bacterium]|nr:alpha/beta fold hydrolase [Longimicrobiales bacterium]
MRRGHRARGHAWARRMLVLAALLGASGAAVGGDARPATHRGVEAEAARVSAPLPVEVPVLLVPGWLDTERDLAALRIRLIGAGWSSQAVESMTFEDPTGSNFVHAREIGDAVEALRERTGAERVDIVAHSMGGLATRLYLMNGGEQAVRRVVFMATPHRGTYVAYLAFGEGREEMKPDSDFLEELNSAPPVPPGVEAMTLRSSFDAVIVPGESATLPGLENHEICCPSHAGLLKSEDAFRLVRRFLLDGPGGGTS